MPLSPLRTLRALAGVAATALAVASLQFIAVGPAAAADDVEHGARRSMPTYVTAPSGTVEVGDAPVARFAAGEVATVGGRVINMSGIPLGGITVDLFGFAGVQGPDAELVAVATTTTDSAGDWVRNDVPVEPDYWEVRFTDPNGTYATSFWADSSVYHYPDMIHPTAGGVVTGVDETMREAATIYGTLSGLGFTPEAGSLEVEVVVFDSASDSWVLTGDVRPVADDLTYSIDGLYPISYRVAVFYTGVRGDGLGVSDEIIVDPGESIAWNGVVERDVIGPDRDFSADGSADVLARTSTGALKLYRGNGTGGFSTSSQIGSGWSSFNTMFWAGDFSGDGRADVIARDTTGALWLYPGNGAGGWGVKAKIGSGWQIFTSILSPGDFDNDGNVDVLARTSAGQLRLYRGNGAGGWLPYKVVGSGWHVFSVIVGAGDFNGDGAADVFARDGAGTLWLYRGNGTGGWLTRVQAGTGWSSLYILG